MITKGLVAILAGLFFACQSNMPAMAADADVNAGFVASAIGAHELNQIRGGMTIPRVKEIVVVGLRPQEAIKSVIPELSGIVVLAGVPEAASGISEALIMTAAEIRETIGQIAAGVRTVRRTALQQGRALLDSD